MVISDDEFTPPGPNVARGKTYSLEPTPEYPLCTDASDKTQLTDGVYAPRELNGKPVGMWVCKECAGCRYRPAHTAVIAELQVFHPRRKAGLSLATAVTSYSR